MKAHEITCLILGVFFIILVLSKLTFGRGSLRYRARDALVSAVQKGMLSCGIGKFDVARATNVLRRFKVLCDDCGVPVLLAEGTALGAVRDARLIEYDDDVDVQVLMKHKQRFLRCVLPRLLKNDPPFAVTKVWNEENFVSFISEQINLDVEFIESGQECSCTISGCVPCPVDFILDTVVSVSLDGEMFDSWGPAMLERVYGSDWRVPKHRFNATSRV